MGILKTVDDLIEPLRQLANRFASPLLDLGIRVFMASVFFPSGWQKFKNFLNDDWGATLFLFQEAHIVPFLPPHVAAIAGTATELILPILLAVGLFTRFSAAGLLFTTILIQYFVVDAYGDDLSNPDHYLWMLLLAVPFIKGPGVISIDALLVRFIRR